jgi:hypothetical protein
MRWCAALIWLKRELRRALSEVKLDAARASMIRRSINGILP